MNRIQRRVAGTWTTLALVAVAAGAGEARGEAYTVTRHTSSMHLEARTVLPGRADVVDQKEQEEDFALGDFDRSLSVSAMDSDGAASVSVQGMATQEVRYGPESITGLLRIQGTSQESDGRGLPDLDNTFNAYFQVPGSEDLPFVLSGHLRRVPVEFNAATTVLTFAIRDEDRPDLHVFGAAIHSDEYPDEFEVPLLHSGVLLAGHRYRVIGFLSFDSYPNLPTVGTIERSIDAEVSFTISVPEPGMALPLLGAVLLSRRRRAFAHSRAFAHR